MSDPVATYEYFDVYRGPQQKGRKTPMYRLINRHSSSLLGVIEWYGSWRQFCFFPEDMTVWSDGCLREVRDFIAKAKQDYQELKRRRAAGIEVTDG